MIKNKKKGTLGQSRKRDFIEIVAKLKVPSPTGGWTTSGEQTIYNNYADVKRVSEYRTVQYGFESSNVLYDIFLNPTAITENMPDFNSDFNIDFNMAIERSGIKGSNSDYKNAILQESIKAQNIAIIYRGKRMKVHFMQDIDDNLGQNIRIVAIGNID